MWGKNEVQIKPSSIYVRGLFYYFVFGIIHTMSHTIYTTDAIVLHKVNTGESDVTLWLLTKELGLIIARAQGARKEVAKMRANIQLFSLFKASLVRGKYVWRVTGTESVQGGSLDTLALSIFARISAFVRRMILTDTQGGSELFEITKKVREKLLKDGGMIESTEREAIAKILISLGYIEPAILSKMEHNQITQRELAHIVNNALANSHL